MGWKMVRDWVCLGCGTEYIIKALQSHRPVLYPDWEYRFCVTCLGNKVFKPIGDFRWADDQEGTNRKDGRRRIMSSDMISICVVVAVVGFLLGARKIMFNVRKGGA